MYRFLFIAASLEEKLADVGAMDGHMAAHAFPGGLETQAAVRDVYSRRIDVALQTQESPLAPQEHVALDTSVGAVAGRTTFHLDGRMFMQEGTALFGVAAGADFKVDLLELRALQGTVGVVTIGTLHEAFGYSVVRGKSELRLNLFVTAEAQLGLSIAQQALGQPARLGGPRGEIEEAGLGGALRARCGWID